MFIALNDSGSGLFKAEKGKKNNCSYVYVVSAL
jgi:hypothetical protein